MAIDFSNQHSDDEPYNNFVYKVEIDDVPIGGFTKVSGLSMQCDTIEYQEGGLHDVTHTFPTRVSHSNIKLHRGMTAHDDFIEWITNSIHYPHEEIEHDVVITMKNRQDEATWGWKLINAYPVFWDGPEVVANANRFAVELLELAYEEFDYIKY